MTRPPTLVITDDHPILREGLKDYFGREGGFEIVGTAGDAQSAVHLCREHQPDVLLLDVEMPGRDSLGALGDIRAVAPATRVVMLTAFCRDAVIDAAVRGGAVGYLLKSDQPPAILAALKQVLEGRRVYSKDVAIRIAEHGSGGARTAEGVSRLAGLTPREMEVLRYIGKGRSNAEMASAMHLSIRTVERHVLRLMGKLGIHSRSSLTALAHESGLV